MKSGILRDTANTNLQWSSIVQYCNSVTLQFEDVLDHVPIAMKIIEFQSDDKYSYTIW